MAARRREKNNTPTPTPVLISWWSLGGGRHEVVSGRRETTELMIAMVRRHFQQEVRIENLRDMDENDERFSQFEYTLRSPR